MGTRFNSKLKVRLLRVLCLSNGDVRQIGDFEKKKKIHL
jgi:hypothetical protein